MAKPEVSIIVPMHNASPFLTNCLESLAAQTFTDFEALIVDDASTDGGELVAREFSRRDSRFHLLTSNGYGVSAARNVGLRAGQGRYLAFLDADDLWPSNSLRARVNKIRSLSGENIVAGPWSVIGPHGESLRLTMGRMLAPLNFQNAIYLPTHIGAVMGPADIMRRFAFDPSRRNGEDTDYLLRLLRSGVLLHHVDTVALYYRWHTHSVVRSALDRHAQALADLLNSFCQPDKSDRVAAKFADGWPEHATRERQARIYIQLGVQLILGGASSTPVESAFAQAERCLRGAGGCALAVNDLWVAAVRVFLLPDRSAALSERICAFTSALLDQAKMTNFPLLASVVRQFIDEALTLAGAARPRASVRD